MSSHMTLRVDEVSDRAADDRQEREDAEFARGMVFNSDQVFKWRQAFERGNLIDPGREAKS